MGANTVERGATADRVAENIAAVRVRRGLTQRGLVERMRELGKPMHASALADVERKKRRVDVDELVALAVALDTTPNQLLIGDSREVIELTPTTVMPATEAWVWARRVPEPRPQTIRPDGTPPGGGVGIPTVSGGGSPDLSAVPSVEDVARLAATVSDLQQAVAELHANSTLLAGRPPQDSAEAP